ncbi:DUF4367 domain-containing protein [Clostridium sp. Marseille-P299]|uniref:DUF4367 domain-containing protein n=1 Tax=Clostridium sp. Marseille-P299 TaxID=1805477 RepID=UPI000833F9E5|nr:DUF4367 domain-containing protein [Clostridium sp. Marseille-P299]
MSSQISVTELEKKTVEELREMLADENILPLDDVLNSDLILKITEVIIKKENKTDDQRETERIAFWARLLINHGDKLPIRLDDVVKRRNVTTTKQEYLGWNYSEVLHRVKFRRFAAVAAVILLLLMGNTISAYAFNFNILQTIAGFTDNVFHKTFVSMENEEITHLSVLPEKIESSTYESFQDALDVYGISEVKEPTWLPSNYQFVGVQVSDTSEYDIIASIYKNEEKSITVTVIKYSEIPSGQTRSFEKSEGTPFIFSYNGIDHYIFSNVDKTMVTWTIGMNECDVQGDVSFDEMKSILESMYMEDK